MKCERYKKHLIDGHYYSIRQLTIKLGINHHRIKARIIEGATTFEELKSSKKNTKINVNYLNSMYVDKHGHWRLLAKALGC